MTVFSSYVLADRYIHKNNHTQDLEDKFISAPLKIQRFGNFSASTSLFPRLLIVTT